MHRLMVGTKRSRTQNAHNHPSGSPEPSRADQQLTLTLKTTLALIDVRVIDHFVVAGDRICSFAERGLV
jgi:DNA repair protein RadC